jgi:hypothetical protein
MPEHDLIDRLEESAADQIIDVPRDRIESIPDRRPSASVGWPGVLPGG